MDCFRLILLISAAIPHKCARIARFLRARVIRLPAISRLRAELFPQMSRRQRAVSQSTWRTATRGAIVRSWHQDGSLAVRRSASAHRRCIGVSSLLGWRIEVMHRGRSSAHGDMPDISRCQCHHARRRSPRADPCSHLWTLRQMQAVFEEDWHVVGCCHLSGL